MQVEVRLQNALGRVIGVAIAGGSGYTSPPLLSFFDSCDKGICNAWRIC